MAVPQNCVKLTRMFYTVAERPDGELSQQFQQAADVVDGLVSRPLLPFQRDALLCLVADIIAGLASSPTTTFPNSLLLKAINRGMFQIAAAEFHSFCFTKGQLQPKAWHKRKAEQRLFSKGELLF